MGLINDPLRDRCVLKPRPDIHVRALSSHLLLAGGMAPSYRDGDEVNTGAVGVDYRWYGDRLAFCEVLKVGAVHPYGWASEVPAAVGDIVLVHQADTEHVLGPVDPTNRVNPLHKQEVLIGFQCLMAKWHEAFHTFEALSNWVVSKPDEEVQRRLDLTKGSKLVLPGEVNQKGTATNKMPLTQVKVMGQRIVSVGPGKFIGMLNRDTGYYKPGTLVYEKPAVRKGDAVVFMRQSAVLMTIFGVDYRAIPWSELACTIDMED